ncbi:MAG: hypothetical protein M3N54_11620, partial [Acidobacteriota bacterium]|nr:hypothetical protein [Acidobacteriota bacterium]
MRTLILLASFASLAAGQNIQRSVHLRNAPNQQGYQEILTVLRTVVDIRDASADAPAQSLTIGGTSAQIAMSEWIIQLLDQPVDPAATEKLIRASAAWQYRAPGPTDDVLRVFYLKNVSNPQSMQELLTN